MDFNQKMKNVGSIAFVLGLLGLFGVAGGVETLPADAGFREWFSLLGAAVTSAMLALFGVSLLQE
jgi:hypothetical protein